MRGVLGDVNSLLLQGDDPDGEAAVFDGTKTDGDATPAGDGAPAERVQT